MSTLKSGNIMYIAYLDKQKFLNLKKYTGKLGIIKDTDIFHIYLNILLNICCATVFNLDLNPEKLKRIENINVQAHFHNKQKCYLLGLIVYLCYFV